MSAVDVVMAFLLGLGLGWLSVVVVVIVLLHRDGAVWGRYDAWPDEEDAP